MTAPKSPPTPPPGRSIELEIILLATPAEIWEALSTADGLAQWFPPIAEGGGAPHTDLLISWGEGIDWRTHITAWDENHHLQWSDPPNIASTDGGNAIPVAVDWYIEPITGGRCVVRLIHSGFTSDANSNEQYNANKEGWTYFLFNLRHYLERHPSATRVAINERRLSTLPRTELWTRLLGAGALNATTHGTRGLRVGDRLSFTMEKGRSIPFVVGRVEPAILWGTAETLNDGLLMIEMEPGAAEFHFGIYLSVYGLPRRDLDSLRAWIATVADAAIA